LDAVIDDAFGDEVGHGCVIGCWWERSVVIVFGDELNGYADKVSNH
jgi:hypothetical protein